MGQWSDLMARAALLWRGAPQPPTTEEVELADEVQARQDEVARRLLALQVRVIRSRPVDQEGDADGPVS